MVITVLGRLEKPDYGSIWLRQCRIVGEPNWTGDNLPEGK